jgi:putative component of membrane protein insertase Oxa1/YidC/SpoIIIJ protein YidD
MLPEDILIEIITHLNITSVISFLRCNVKLYTYYNNIRLWRLLLSRDFQNKINFCPFHNYLNSYIRMYKIHICKLFYINGVSDRCQFIFTCGKYTGQKCNNII